MSESSTDYSVVSQALFRMALGLGVMSTIYILCTMWPAWTKRHFAPLRFRNMPLLLLYCSMLAMWNVFSFGSVSFLPCNIGFIGVNVALILIGSCLTSMALQTYFRFSFNADKTRLLKKGFADWSHDSKVRLERTKFLMSNSSAWKMFAAHTIFFCSIFFIFLFALDFEEKVKNTSTDVTSKEFCGDSYSDLLTIPLVLVTDVIILSVVAHKLRKFDADSAGLKFDFILNNVCWIVIFLWWMIFSTFLDIHGPTDLFIQCFSAFLVSLLVVRRYFQTYNSVDYRRLLATQSKRSSSGTQSQRDMSVLNEDQNEDTDGMVVLNLSTTVESFVQAMQFEELFNTFLSFLDKEFSSENLLFYAEVQSFRKELKEGQAGRPMIEHFRTIFDKYIDPEESISPINLPFPILSKLVEMRTGKQEITRKSCDQALSHITKLLVSDSWRRFVKSIDDNTV